MSSRLFSKINKAIENNGEKIDNAQKEVSRIGNLVEEKLKSFEQNF
jgi:hypothetical protein